MGNNKKTVRCSFCGTLGHNRVSCPKLKKYVSKVEKKYGENHPDVKEHKSYMETYSNKSRENATKERKCSYCHTSGHNSRTCVHFKADYSKIKRINHKWRKNLIRILKNRKIGLGAIVSTCAGDASPWTIVSIDWIRLNWVTDNAPAFKVIKISNPGHQKYITLEQIINQVQSYYYNWVVVSPGQELDYPEKWDQLDDPDFDNLCSRFFESMTAEKFESYFLNRTISTSSWLRADIYRQFIGDSD